MKKIFLFFICIIMTVSFSACSLSSKAPVYPKSISFNDIDSEMKNKNENKLDENFVQSLNNFSYESASKILRTDKNINYSPVSLYMALSIAGTGAKNKTQNEIFSVLNEKGKSIDYLSNENSKLFRLLYLSNEIGKLKIANSIWIKKNISFNKSFAANARNNFYASIFNIDFNDKNSLKLMNNWISQNTNGNISPNVSADKKQIMTILNTIYYKDQWSDRFDKNATKPDTFYLSNGSKVKSDFMNITYPSHGFIKGTNFTESYLNLKNGGSMVFVLPDKGVSAESLISTPEKTASLFNNKNNTFGKVIFQIPKFSYGNSLNLNDTLKSMGIETAFEQNNADFSGITNNKAFLSNIKQQTHISIDEKGVEASAFTKIDYVGSALPKNEVAEMILNRPFIFAVKSNNVILFVGIVNNPDEK